MKATHSRQRTVPVTCATRLSRNRRGSVSGAAPTLATTGTTGAFIVTLARASAMTSPRAASARSGRVRKRAASPRAWRPSPWRSRAQRSTAALVPETTTWPSLLSLAAWQTSPCAASAAAAAAVAKSRPEQGRPWRRCPRAWRSASQARGLQAAAPHRRARRCRRRPAPNIHPANGRRRIRRIGDGDAMLGLEHAHHRHGNRHQGGLGILGEREVGLRPSHIRADSFWPSASSTSSNTARAAAKPSASPCPCRRPGCPGPET
jgi:hypothetical protein